MPVATALAVFLVVGSGQFVSVLAAPLRGLVTVLAGPIRGFVTVLSKKAEQTS